MGCGVSTIPQRKTYSTTLILKLAPSLQRTTSNITINGSLSRLNSTNKAPCLKLKILPNDLKFLKKSINLSGTEISMTSFKYSKQYKQIKQNYIQYISTSRYFYTQVHEVCFNHFNITDGIFIMLISIFANKDLKISFSPNFPFISFQGMMEVETDEIFEAWTSYLQVLELLSKNNCEQIKVHLHKMQELLTLLHQSIENTLRIRKLNRAIKATESAMEACRALIFYSESQKAQILDFFAKIKQKLPDIQYFSSKAEKFSLFSGQKIVHRLFENNII